MAKENKGSQISKNVNLSPCFVKYLLMRTYARVNAQLRPFLTSVLENGEQYVSCLNPFTRVERDMKIGGHQSICGTKEKRGTVSRNLVIILTEIQQKICLLLVSLYLLLPFFPCSSSSFYSSPADFIRSLFIPPNSSFFPADIIPSHFSVPVFLLRPLILYPSILIFLLRQLLSFFSYFLLIFFFVSCVYSLRVHSTFLLSFFACCFHVFHVLPSQSFLIAHCLHFYLFFLPSFLLPLLPLFSYFSVPVFVPLTFGVIPSPSSAQAGCRLVKVSGHVQRHSRVGGARNQLKVIEKSKRSYLYDRTSFRSVAEVRGEVMPQFQSGNF